MAKIMKKAQSGKTVNTQRTKGSDPLSTYSPNIKRGSGNLIPVGAKKHPVTGKPLSAPKAKSGGSFPDLNKDGKVTKADILKGRGVIAKKGIKTAKKMKNGGMLAAPTKGGVSMQLGSYTRQIGKNYTGKNVVNKGAKAKMGKSMGKCKYGC